MICEVTIRGDVIRLGQLLKLSGVAADGTEARALISAGQVSVNDRPETRRGRQLHPGDVVAVAGETLRVVGAAGAGE